MSDLLDLARQVQVAAEAFSSGKVSDNLQLLRAIRNLNRIAESPTDRLRKILYQVDCDFILCEVLDPANNSVASANCCRSFGS